jgi:hypothetical protein
VRCQVAERQLAAYQVIQCLHLTVDWGKHAKPRLVSALTLLARALGCEVADLELHHRPALVNREWIARRNDYDPPANSPDHLIYLPETDHDIETRIRGVGAQRSDLSQARYLKKVARNRETGRKASEFPKPSSRVKRTTNSVVKVRRPKQKWPKRKFPKRKI